MNRFALLLLMSALSAPAQGREAFIDNLQPCLRQLQRPGAEPIYRVVLDQGWTAGLFAIAPKDGGDLGTDLCGDLDGGGMAFAGTFIWPASLGPAKAIDQSLITPVWLERIVQSARRSLRAPDQRVQRISVTALPAHRAHLVRVQFSDRQGKSTSVDLSELGVVIKRDARVPDDFERKPDSAPKPVAAKSAAPTVDPQGALRALLAKTTARSNATVLRLTLTNFDAGLVYQNGAGAAIRQTQFNFIDGERLEVTDAEFDFPPAFKACAMRLDQVKSAVSDVVTQRRYKASAARLQYLLLECSQDKPKPHWSLVAMEPFEYFDLPADL